jgi:nucleoporin NDC1
VYIAQQFQGRRKNIFEDIDRKGGSAWSQILAICLEVITGIDARITEFEAPTVIKKPEGEKKEEIPSLPRIGQPLKDGLKQPGDLFDATPPPKSRGAGVIQAVGSFAKAHGQSPPGPLPRNKLLELGLSKFEDIALSPKKKDLKEKGLVGLLKNWAILILNTKAGWPFRQEYRRRVAAIVLGSPYGDVGIIVDAVDSLTRLAVCSLKEDKYGNVQRDIKLIIRTFTTTVTKLERFKKSIGFHWSDVAKKEESPEVDSILAALKDGLKELISDKAFGDYSEDLRLSQSEMRQAREAATPAKAREMQQTGI